jgi:hypothetical protein
MDFDKRLKRAIERGQQARDVKSREQAEQQLTAEQLRNLHSGCRLELSEHIEDCLKRLADHFPGFRFETVVGEEGWGAKISRDDFAIKPGGERANLFSRLEMVVRQFSQAHIVELAAKGTVRNKEVLNRTHFQFLSQLDVESFSELIDLWILDYAEQYSARA